MLLPFKNHRSIQLRKLISCPFCLSPGQTACWGGTLPTTATSRTSSSPRTTSGRPTSSWETREIETIRIENLDALKQFITPSLLNLCQTHTYHHHIPCLTLFPSRLAYTLFSIFPALLIRVSINPVLDWLN